jgi:iron complex outermembrane recepter protein
MMIRFSTKATLSCGLALTALTIATAAAAQQRTFDVPSEDASKAIPEFARQAGLQITAPADQLEAVRTPAIKGTFDTRAALRTLLAGTGLIVAEDDGAIIMLRREAAAAAGGTSDTAPKTSDGRAADAVLLEEVVVTAQKRAERLQDVPLSVTAVDSQSLLQQNLVGLADYATRIPGLYVGGTGQSDISIRGITTGFGTNPSVAVTVDDVPFGSSTNLAQGDTLDLDPANIKQVEVLRGPQGTLYGASSLGGLIRYVTVEPDTHTYSGTFETDGEAVDHGGGGYAVRGLVNIPLVSDTAALRVSGFYRSDPLYGEDVLTNTSDVAHDHVYGGHAALLWMPIDDLTVDVAALIQHNREYAERGEEFLNSNYTPTYGLLEYSSIPSYTYDTDGLYSIAIKYNLGFATISSTTAYGQFRGAQSEDLTEQFANIVPALRLVGIDVPSADRTFLDNVHSVDKVSEELRLASKSTDKLEWLLGAFTTHESTATDQILNANGSGESIGILSADGPSTYEEVAGFADLTYHFTSQFDVQVGGRYAHNDQTFDIVESGPLEALETGKATPQQASTRSNDDAFTWLVTPRYRFTSNLMAYTRIATGYRPGGPNTPVGTSLPPTYQPDTTTNYEIGTKGAVLDHRLSFDVDAFWVDWAKIQLLNTATQTGLSYFTNGGGARSRGFEAAVDFKPWRSLTLYANTAFTDAALTQTIPVPAAATPVYGTSGERLPYSARFTGNLGSEQTFGLTEGSVLFIGGNISYVGARLGSFTDSATLPRVSLPAYTQVDLRAGVHRGGYSITLFVRNVGDSHGFQSGSYQTPGELSQGYLMRVIQPRTLGLNLTGSF